MPNPYFKFKEFLVYHDKCAMKVGTDGVLLGAWVTCINTDKILDIGTGTGLLALMLAQKSKAKIDAIEIDREAFKQAISNIQMSKWADRINLKLISFQAYIEECTTNYDLIISNPPFFENALKTPDRKRNMARHNDSLTEMELLKGSAKLLTKSGKICLVYPADSFEKIKLIAAKHKLFINQILWIKPNEQKPPKRILIELSKIEKPIIEKTLSIELKKRHEYSKEYKSLTKDYYLAF